MRKIKFRIFDNDEKIMYKQKDLIVSYSYLGEDCFINTREEVRPLYSYEIMQYTGLKDKNGKEIYEGDIVKIEDYFGEDIVGKVVYDKVTAAYVFYKGDKTNYFQMSLDLENYVFYIIGNIYENPELLK